MLGVRALRLVACVDPLAGIGGRVAGVEIRKRKDAGARAADRAGKAPRAFGFQSSRTAGGTRSSASARAAICQNHGQRRAQRGTGSARPEHELFSPSQVFDLLLVPVAVGGALWRSGASTPRPPTAEASRRALDRELRLDTGARIKRSPISTRTAPLQNRSKICSRPYLRRGCACRRRYRVRRTLPRSRRLHRQSLRARQRRSRPILHSAPMRAPGADPERGVSVAVGWMTARGPTQPPLAWVCSN